MSFKKGQRVWVKVPGKPPRLDVVRGPHYGFMGIPIKGMVALEKYGSGPEEYLEPAWFGWCGNPSGRFGQDPNPIEVGSLVKTILGVRAKILSIDPYGYCRLQGVTGTRYVAHLKWVGDPE